MIHPSKAINGFCSWKIKLTDAELKEAKKHNSLPAADRVKIEGSRLEGWVLKCVNYGVTCPICRNCEKHCVGHVGLLPHVDPTIPIAAIAIEEGIEQTRMRLRETGWDYPMTDKARCPDGHVGCLPHTPEGKEKAA